jgi:hypothetical protein
MEEILFSHHVRMMRCEGRGGFLNCAAHDDALSVFGRNDTFLY